MTPPSTKNLTKSLCGSLLGPWERPRICSDTVEKVFIPLPKRVLLFPIVAEIPSFHILRRQDMELSGENRIESRRRSWNGAITMKRQSGSRMIGVRSFRNLRSARMKKKAKRITHETRV